jgi:OOP family OmpA-OmpF porin
VEIDDYELESISTSLDDEDFGYRVFGGWRFSEHFGVGISYLDLGELEASGNSTEAPNFTDTIEADGFELWIAGILPIADRWSLFGTVGAFAWDQEVSYADDNGTFNGSSDGTDVSYGAGVNYEITERLGMHAAYHWYPNIGDVDDTGHENDREFYGIGLTWLFGDLGAPAAAAAVAAPVAAAAAAPSSPPPPPPPVAPADSDGDGVVDGSDMCPQTPRGNRVDRQGCSCDVTANLTFDTDSAELSAADKALLDQAADILMRLQSAVGTIEGHTDSQGSDAHNQGLSERRAQAAADHLRSRGVNLEGVKVVGFGESQPVGDNATAEGRAQNRRVVLKRTVCD